MSLTATLPAVSREPAETRKLALLVWAATVVAYLVAGGGPSLSTDDAMRLVQVRDWLGGQAWFDLTQYRLDPPGGVVMHWSRLVDVPIALLIRLGETALPPASAERVAAVVWPAMLLLGFLIGVVWLARELAGDAAARLAVIFAALMAPVLQHFRPGALDHHNLQLVLMLWTVALLIRERPRDAAIAGAVCALSLAIGQELAPVIATCAGMVTLRWIVRGDESRPATIAFAWTFAAMTALLFVATVAPARYAVATCDALSLVQMLGAGIGGFGLALLAALVRSATTAWRLAGAAALGAVLAAMIAIGFPACLGDPYAFLDPRLSTLWLSNVAEARSIAGLVRDLPQEVVLYYALPVVGVALGLYRSWREQDLRWPWAMATAVLAMATLIALWQVRGCAAANALALAMVPAALLRGLQGRGEREVFFGMGRAVLVAALLLNPITLLGIGKASAWTMMRATGTHPPAVLSDGPGTCRKPADYAPLARLPRGLALGFIDAGPLILMETPHAVLAAPYHRNITGNAAMLDVFLAVPDEAVSRLAALGMDYLAFCPGSPERHNYTAAAPEGLAAALGRGEIPVGFERIALEGTELMVLRRRP
jgi:hypothetical protein